MKRSLMMAAALALPVAGVALVGLPGVASAKGAPKVTITCHTITGTISGDITVGGCSGGNTGGSSKPLLGIALATGGTITWVSGSTTTIGHPALVSSTSSKCGAGKGTVIKFTAPVTGGTGTDMPISGTGTGEICEFNGAITALKPMKTKGPS